MRLHPRTMPVQAAEVELHTWLVDWQERHDLTSIEALGCLFAAGQRVTKYALRAERHPDDPDQPADAAAVVERVSIYPPNEQLYGRCDACGQVKWHTERYHGDGSGQEPERNAHCGCCSHPHDLPPGDRVLGGVNTSA